MANVYECGNALLVIRMLCVFINFNLILIVSRQKNVEYIYMIDYRRRQFAFVFIYLTKYIVDNMLYSESYIHTQHHHSESQNQRGRAIFTKFENS